MAAEKKTRRARKVTVKNLVASDEYADIHADLLDQLERNGTIGKYYVDLVSDYMNLWVTKNLLNDDIKKRGVSVEYNHGGGQSGYKKNDSVDQTLKVNGQMLKILDSIGIKPTTVLGGGDDDEL